MKKIQFFILITLIVTNITIAQTAKQSIVSNPLTLVYEGAITENLQGKVNIHPVKYKLREISIVANVYTPPNFNVNKKYPTIVIAHPNGGVKEQVAGLYAERLAEQGYITIAADAAYQGGVEVLHEMLISLQIELKTFLEWWIISHYSKEWTLQK